MPELNFSINGRQAVSGAKTVVKALDSITKKSKSLITSAINPLTAAIGAFAGFKTAEGLIKTGDAYTIMASQLEYVEGSATGAAEAQDELYKMSQKTRTSVTANATALVRLSQANEMTGLTTKENIKIIGGLNALMLKTGTAGASAEAATNQLTQALASGTLAGDEFKSIAENAPAVMAEFARSLGVPRGELKQMAADGKITSAVMVEALNKIANEAEASFSSMPKTAAAGWQLVVNAFERAWDIINDENGIMGFIFDAFERFSFWIEENSPMFSDWALLLVDRLVAAWPVIKEFLLSFYNGLVDMFNLVYDNWDSITGFFGGIIDAAIWAQSSLGPIIDYMMERFEALLYVIDQVKSWQGVAQAEQDLATQEQYSQNQADSSGGQFYDYGTGSFDSDGTNITPDSSGDSLSVSKGVSIINNFAQKLNKSEVVSITAQQTRMFSRL